MYCIGTLSTFKHIDGLSQVICAPLISEMSAKFTCIVLHALTTYQPKLLSNCAGRTWSTFPHNGRHTWYGQTCMVKAMRQTFNHCVIMPENTNLSLNLESQLTSLSWLSISVLWICIGQPVKVLVHYYNGTNTKTRSFSSLTFHWACGECSGPECRSLQ